MSYSKFNLVEVQNLDSKKWYKDTGTDKIDYILYYTIISREIIILRC